MEHGSENVVLLLLLAKVLTPSDIPWTSRLHRACELELAVAGQLHLIPKPAVKPDAGIYVAEAPSCYAAVRRYERWPSI